MQRLSDNYLDDYSDAMGANIWDILKDPKDYVQAVAQSWESKVEDWAYDNLPPELNDVARKFIDENKHKGEEFIKAGLIDLAQKHLVTDANVDALAQSGIQASFTNLGDKLSNDYVTLANAYRNGMLMKMIATGKAPASAYVGLGIVGIITLKIIF